MLKWIKSIGAIIAALIPIYAYFKGRRTAQDEVDKLHEERSALERDKRILEDRLILEEERTNKYIKAKQEIEKDLYESLRRLDNPETQEEEDYLNTPIPEGLRDD